jgi:hypothetical protein
MDSPVNPMLIVFTPAKHLRTASAIIAISHSPVALKYLLLPILQKRHRATLLWRF